MYWYTILTRNKDELISQVYYTMKDKPLKEDWIFLLKKDLEKIGLYIEDEEKVTSFSKDCCNSLVKKQTREVALREFETMKSKHEKVRTIVHKNTNLPQNYLTNGWLNEQCTEKSPLQPLKPM